MKKQYNMIQIVKKKMDQSHQQSGVRLIKLTMRLTNFKTLKVKMDAASTQTKRN